MLTGSGGVRRAQRVHNRNFTCSCPVKASTC